MASGIIFEETECKSIINKSAAPGLFKWSVNPYRGCQHACVYCFARAHHGYLGYDAGRDFESRVIVKVNAAEVLRRELSRPGWAGEVIVLGTACDPYQQAEMKYEITRKMLRVLIEFGQAVHMLTKSPSVLRDIDLWAELAAISETQVAFSVPTLDEAVWKVTEPGTSRPVKRLQAMRKLVDAGVRCGVMLAPIIPGVTDDEGHIEEVVRAARDHGASFVAPNVLYLRPGTREWFMPALREAYPHLEAQYERYYKGAYAPKEYTQQVLAKVQEIRERYGMERSRLGPGRESPRRRGQLALALEC